MFPPSTPSFSNSNPEALGNWQSGVGNKSQSNSSLSNKQHIPQQQSQQQQSPQLQRQPRIATQPGKREMEVMGASQSKSLEYPLILFR